MRSTYRLRGALIAAAMASPLFAGNAGAQSSPEDKAKGQSLYDAAMALIAENKYADACPKLEEVTQLVPEGVGAKIELANCYKGWGRLASAYRQYMVAAKAAADAGQTARQTKAAQAATALLPSLSTLTIVVPLATRSLPGIEVRRDGGVVNREDWGVSIPVDGGTHEIRVTATGKREWKQVIEVPPSGAKESVEIGELEAEQAAAVPALPPGVGAPASSPSLSPSLSPTRTSEPPPSRPSDLPPARVQGSFWSPLRGLGLAAGLVGVAGVVAGSYYGVQSKTKRDQSREDGHCVNGNQCDEIGAPLLEDAVAAGNVSTGLFIPGAALLVGGVSLLVWGPGGSAVSRANVVLGPRGVEVLGRW